MRKYAFDDDMDADVDPAKAFGYLIFGLSILILGLFMG